MPNSCTELYVHFVWATWDRQPLITPDIEPQVYACVASRCRDMQAHLLAVGGVANHVHVLLRLPATKTVAQLAGDIKGSTSHLITHVLGRSSFRWQGAYHARTVNPGGISRVCDYIANQKTHHAQNTLYQAWEIPDDPDDVNEFRHQDNTDENTTSP